MGKGCVQKCMLSHALIYGSIPGKKLRQEQHSRKRCWRCGFSRFLRSPHIGNSCLSALANLVLDQPWLAPPAWSRQRRIETPSCDQPRGAFLNRVSECDRHFSSCNVVLVAERLLQDATLSFRILFPFTAYKNEFESSE